MLSSIHTFCFAKLESLLRKHFRTTWSPETRHRRVYHAWGRLTRADIYRLKWSLKKSVIWCEIASKIKKMRGARSQVKKFVCEAPFCDIKRGCLKLQIWDSLLRKETEGRFLYAVNLRFLRAKPSKMAVFSRQAKTSGLVDQMHLCIWDSPFFYFILQVNSLTPSFSLKSIK